jgi:hypothetical protein
MRQTSGSADGNPAARPEQRRLADLLMDLEDNLGEIARLVLIDGLRNALG